MLHIVRLIQYSFPRHSTRIIAVILLLSFVGLAAWAAVLVLE